MDPGDLCTHTLQGWSIDGSIVVVEVYDKEGTRRYAPPRAVAQTSFPTRSHCLTGRRALLFSLSRPASPVLVCRGRVRPSKWINILNLFHVGPAWRR